MTGNRPPGRPTSSSGELEDQRHPEGPVESAVLLDQAFDRGSLYALRATLEAHASQAGLPEGRSADPGGTVVTVDFALPSPLRPAFKLTRHSQNGRTTLSLVGDLDQRTAPDVIATVEDLISTTKRLRLVLDLSGMTFWDSTGITALVTAQEHVAAASGATMALAGLSTEHQGRLDSLGFVSFTYDNASH
ncbi:STAS domain-containing protein [Nonomuraea aurantiaca]|uniref:STAS domain-containing protein n=1 Tax=Nonomuraea aurantiaca TaxID=2878562 RepID=UPI001CD992E0|nr:STAS domain-containing protein [Nonomuraea aurantiaca]MCA2225256.1 STAS domain-containing protein [Nonomuraea aurantiaca]